MTDRIQASPPFGAPRAPDASDGALERLAMRLTRVLRGHYERTAAAHGMTPPQATALRNLDAPMPMGTLAERMRCDASYITTLADALEARGWAERRPDPADRRVRQLAPTPAGRAIADAFVRELADTSPLARALDPDERIRFGAMLERIVAADAAHPVDAAGGDACSPPPCDAG